MRRNFNPSPPLKTITANYTFDCYTNLLADASSNTITVTLDDSKNYSGKSLTIKKIDSSNNNVTISPVSPQSIDGQSLIIINQQYSSVTLMSDGSNWHITKE